MDDNYDDYDDFDDDYCEDCREHGNDYILNELGEWEPACYRCYAFPYRQDLDEDD